MGGDGDFNAAGGGRGVAGRRRGRQVRGSRGRETQGGAPARRPRQEFVAEGPRRQVRGSRGRKTQSAAPARRGRGRISSPRARGGAHGVGRRSAGELLE
uniref:Uncharacterized protein n=1 Tax=Triticum urartu TaxID=4572 RepID=A0A8R7K0H5_TRIUA